MQMMTVAKRVGGVVAASALILGTIGVTPAQAARCGADGCPVSVESRTTQTTTNTTTTTETTTKTTSTSTGALWDQPVAPVRAAADSSPQQSRSRPANISAAERQAQRRASVQRDVYGAVQTPACGGPPPAAPCAAPPPPAQAAAAQQAVAPAQVQQQTGTTTTAQTRTRQTVSVEEVVEQAKAKITFDRPDIGSAPCTDSGCQGAVGVPVWLWTQDLPSQSATASAGDKSITVDDQVNKVVWDLGDGRSITCSTSGTEYDTSMGWATSPDCGLPRGYTKAGRYTVTATMHHAIGWSGDASGSESATTSSSTEVVIGEYQAVAVKAGGSPN